MDEPLFTIYTDGLCDPNPGGWATWGWVAYDRTGKEIAQDCDALGYGAGMTNNRAEYEAVLNALRWAEEYEATDVLIRTDSQVVVNHLNGTWEVKQPALAALYEDAYSMLGSVGADIEWVPREKNAVADQLTRDAYDRARAYHQAQHATSVVTVRVGVYADHPAAVQVALDLLREKVGEPFHQGKAKPGPKGGYVAYSTLAIEVPDATRDH